MADKDGDGCLTLDELVHFQIMGEISGAISMV